MVSRLAALAILVFLPLAFLAEVQAYGRQTTHEVGQYDEAGPFRTTLDIPRAERAKMSAEIRDFIWDHWKQHRRGRFQMITQTIEGQIKIQKIFIEPDAQGHWHVRDEIRADVHRDVKSAKPQHAADEYDEVRRIDASTGEPISDSEIRAAGTYKLLLTNKTEGLQWSF